MCVSVFLMFNVFKANLIRIPMKIFVNIHSLVLSCSICRGQPGLMEMTLSGERGGVFVGRRWEIKKHKQCVLNGFETKYKGARKYN